MDVKKVQKLCHANNQKKAGVTMCTSYKLNQLPDTGDYQRYKETFMIQGPVHQKDIMYMCLSQMYKLSWSGQLLP